MIDAMKNEREKVFESDRCDHICLWRQICSEKYRADSENRAVTQRDSSLVSDRQKLERPIGERATGRARTDMAAILMVAGFVENRETQTTARKCGDDISRGVAETQALTMRENAVRAVAAGALG